MSRLAASGLAVVLLCGPLSRAAETYRFSSRTDGAYAATIAGRATVDGNRWRIDFDLAPDDVVYLTAIISTADGQLIALDDSQKTWFRLTSRRRLEIDRTLFSYNMLGSVKVTALSVKAMPLAAAGGPSWRIEFSYKIATKISGELVRGRVEGSMSIWTSPDLRSLPWNPVELHTGLPSVDEAIAAALRGIEGTIWQAEIEVGRRLADGPVLRSSIRRTVADFRDAPASDEKFSIPAGYVFREPVLGVPASSSRSH